MNEKCKQRFVAMIPEFERMAGAKFRHLKGDDRDEAIQNSLGIAWKHWQALVKQGRGTEEELRGCLWYATRQTQVGRFPQGQGKAKCVYQAARFGRTELSNSLDGLCGDTVSVADRVAFRLDVRRFFDTLSDRQRRISEVLMSGETTFECARQFGVTPAAISQWRRRFKELFEAYCEA